MRQIIFTLNLFGREIPIYGYGLMLVVAFVACSQIAKRLAGRLGYNGELFVNAAMIAIITGLIGARLCHVLENLGEFTNPHLTFWHNLQNALNVSAGGLTFYGGFLLATPCCIGYALYHRVPIKLGMDVVAIVLMIGLGFGRIGCLLNGCCFGERCDVPTLGMKFPYLSEPYLKQLADDPGLRVPPALLQFRGDGTITPIHPNSPQANATLRQLMAGQQSLPVLPTQVYSSITAFLLAGLLFCYLTLPHIDGRVFALMLVLEGLARFILEMLRSEDVVWNPHLFGHGLGFSISQMFAMMNITAGLVMWWAVGKCAKATWPGGEHMTA